MFNSKVFAALPQFISILEGQALPNRDLKEFNNILKMEMVEARERIESLYGRGGYDYLKIELKDDVEMGGLTWDITIRYATTSGHDYMHLWVFEEVKEDGAFSNDEGSVWLYSLKATSERGTVFTEKEDLVPIFELLVKDVLKVEIGYDYHLVGFDDIEEFMEFLEALKLLVDRYVDELDLLSKALKLSSR